MKKLKLTDEGEAYMECIYEEDIVEVKNTWFFGIGKELMIASLNHAGGCDEANPDQDFIAGALWMRKRCRNACKGEQE